MNSGNRIRLRSFTSHDRESFVGWHLRPSNRAFKWDGELTPEDAGKDFDEILAKSELGEQTYLAIELVAERRAIGQVAMFDSSDEPVSVLAYLIDEPFWGHGYATESVKLLIEDPVHRKQERTLVAIIPERHHASERVVEKLGFSARSRQTRNGMVVRRWELSGDAE